MTNPTHEPMTTPNDSPEGTPGGDRAVPPYDDRKKAADVAPAEEGHEDGAAVGGARRPTETDSELRREEPSETPRGAVASPADEQPATESGGNEPDEGSTGPAHQAGVPRGEDFQ